MAENVVPGVKSVANNSKTSPSEERVMENFEQVRSLSSYTDQSRELGEEASDLLNSSVTETTQYEKFE